MLHKVNDKRYYLKLYNAGYNAEMIGYGFIKVSNINYQD